MTVPPSGEVADFVSRELCDRQCLGASEQRVGEQFDAEVNVTVAGEQPAAGVVDFLRDDREPALAGEDLG